jgi:crotonobetainyl-CoA:carnitine CoA-transferase CaiB-like acyl-CoA transferase
MVVELGGGAPRQLACPVKMTGYQFEVRRTAPQPGEHSDAVLSELGYGVEQRDALRESGAIG